MNKTYLKKTGLGLVGLAAATLSMTASIAAADTGGKMISTKVMGESCDTYVVQPGDTLGQIAQKLTGSSANAELIYRMNAHEIKNINAINQGDVLNVPCEKAIADVADAAIPEPEDKGLWNASAGDYLVPVLVSWGTKAGYDVIVEQEDDWRFAVAYSYDGDFRGAVDEVISGFMTAASAPVVVFYSNDVMTIGVR
jgi:hypothetical protein